MERFGHLFFLITIMKLVLPATSSANLPTEKRLQMCQRMQQSLRPPTTAQWLLKKAGGAVAIGAAITTFLAALDPAYEKAEKAWDTYQRIIKVKKLLRQINASYPGQTTKNTQLSTPEPPPPEEPTFPTPFQVATFIGGAAVSFILLTTCTKHLIKPNASTLKDFLTGWPDYAIYAPQSLREEASSLYGAYQREGDAALGDERTAGVILLAFSIFLAEEIQALTQTLQ